MVILVTYCLDRIHSDVCQVLCVVAIPNNNWPEIYQMFNYDFKEQECLSLHCGQTGIQWGLSCWDLFAAEHNVTTEGKLVPSDDANNLTTLYDFSPFYFQTEDGRFKPRSLFVDCDDNVLDESFSSESHVLFICYVEPTYGPTLRTVEPTQKVFGREQCSSIFGQGLGRNGKTILDRSLEGVRYLLENCDSPQGIIWYHSLGGGTGSGFTTLLAQRVSQEHPGLKMHEFSLLPGAELTCSATDAYNSVLGLHNSLETMGCSYLFDSDVVYKTCFHKLHINNPNHVVLNKVLARVVADVTSTMRFPGIVNGTLADLESNLLPVHRMPFPLVCLQPLYHRNSKSSDDNLIDVIMSCFDKSNQVLECSPKDGKILRSCLILRGQIDMEEVRDGLNALRTNQELKFVTSYGSRAHTTCLLPSKLVDFPENPVTVPRIQVCSLTNSLAVAQIFAKLVKKFDAIFQQRAFLHWYYAEGMEESDFINARDDIQSLLESYENIDK